MEKNNIDNDYEKQIVALFDAKDIQYIDLEQFKKLINSGALDNEMNTYQELWLTNYIQSNEPFTLNPYSEEAWGTYLYLKTDVLINNADLTDAADLKRFEAISTFKKIWFLFHHDVDGEVDKQRLINIHHFVFGDVYPFAGEYRRVNMAKEKGSFLPIEKKEDIDSYLDNLFAEVDFELKNCMGIGQLASILSKLYMKIIYCHPFREGNGRSTREFLRQFSIIKSKELGLGNYELDWSRIDRKQLDEFIGFAYLFPGLGSDIFLNALVKKENQIHI